MNSDTVPAPNGENSKLGLELLRIKGAINGKTASENDIEIFRDCLGKGGDLALIAAGYALSEDLAEAKDKAISVLQKAFAQVRMGGRLPSQWAEVAILEGLVCTDSATLLSLNEDLMGYLKRRVNEPSKIADVINASSLLQRLVALNTEGASDLLRKINEMV
jgi:hypothetical protein